MTGALLILAAVVLAGIVLRLTHRPPAPLKGEEQETPPSGGRGAECCGLHAVCEKQASQMVEPVYFDDEELDRFARRDPATYTDDEVEEFRQVLYTLLPADVYAWGTSLTLREIPLPLPLRDEWIMLCG